jgi:hypothetical protein
MPGIRGRVIGVIAAAALPALVVSGCTSEIDSGKASQLIRQAVAKGNGLVKVRSVACPSGVTAKAGGTFDCKVTLTQVSNGAAHSGTVTVHMTDSKGHVVVNPSDFHIQ